VIRSTVAFVAILCCAASARAQTAPSESGRFEVGIGPLWIGSASFGSRAANETNASGTAVPLFTTTTALDAATGVEVRFGIRLTRRLEVEAAGSYAGPHLVTTVRADSEAGSGPFTSDEWIQQFTAGGAVLWRFAPLRAHPHWVPFAIGGAAYMRQLHEQQTLLVSGRSYEAGAGVKYLLGARAGARLKTVGVRADVRAMVRTAGVNVDGRAHVSPARGASLFVRF